MCFSHESSFGLARCRSSEGLASCEDEERREATGTLLWGRVGCGGGGPVHLVPGKGCACCAEEKGYQWCSVLASMGCFMGDLDGVGVKASAGRNIYIKYSLPLYLSPPLYQRHVYVYKSVLGWKMQFTAWRYQNGRNRDSRKFGFLRTWDIYIFVCMCVWVSVCIRSANNTWDNEKHFIVQILRHFF